MDYIIEHYPKKGLFRVKTGGCVARLSYVRHADRIDFTSTYVPPPLENQGIGSALVRAGLEYAREERLKVRTSCSFVDVFIKRHRDMYSDLL